MWPDIRYGIRALFKNSSFTAVAVLALAVAIGSNTAIFSVFNTVLLRPLSYKNADRLVILALTNPAKNVERGNVSYMDYLAWHNDEVYEHVAAFREATFDITGGDEPEQVQVASVTEDYFSVIGMEPSLGRAFLPEEQKRGSNFVAVLSYGMWQRRFGSDPGVIEKTIGLNGERFRVVGVMAPDSQWPKSLDVLYPMAIGATPPDYARRYDNFVWGAIACLKPGESVRQAQAHLETIARRMEQEHPESRTGWSATVIPIDEWVVGRQFRLALLVLFGAGALVLLIGCANLANLLLARAVTREREFAIRIAVGAGKLRLVRQLITETLLLGIAGGIAGLLLALLGIKLMVAFAPENIPRLNEVSIDGHVLCFVLAVSILTPLAFGLAPAVQASKVDLIESLKDGGRCATGGLGARRIRSLLVAIEVALSLILSISAGLMIKSFVRLQQVDTGFRVDNLLTLRITLPRPRYPNNDQVATSYEKLLTRISALPGVESDCASSSLPLGGGGYYLAREFLIEGQPEPPAGRDYPGHWNVVTNDYFQTMGISLLKGRSFTNEDAADTPLVIIVSETLAHQMFPGQDPLGKRIKSRREDKLREIVGVVADVRYLGRNDLARPLGYVPHRQDTWIAMILAVRTAADPTGLINVIRDEIRAMDKDLAIAHVETMEQVLADSVSRPRFTVLLLSLFAVIALTLAAVGVYSVMSYSVTQRTHEIGIRMALGARPRDLYKLILGEGLAIALVGVGIGLAGAFAVTRIMSSLLFGLTATDPTIYASASLILICVAMAASYFPTRRAVRVDPMDSLRI